jgi:lipid-A-disaccharide synthase-like uncharacterized protein
MMNALIAAADPSAAAGWTQTWLDATEPWEMWWLLLGLLAQVVFFARWIVQWVASELRRESVMPVLFWWCSLVGASMLLVYFIGRREPIGVLGQAIGWAVYGRNLYLIKFRHGSPKADPQSGAA